MSQIPLTCFAKEIKGFCQSSLGNEVDFRDIINASPNILAKNRTIKKLRHVFVKERALVTMTVFSEFSVTMDGKFMIDFCKVNDLSNLIDKPTCYNKPTCIVSRK